MKRGEDFFLGTREIIKAMRAGKVKRVVIAENAPDWIKEELKKVAKETGVKIEKFKGNELRLGIKIGRPFPVACVGFKE